MILGTAGHIDHGKTALVRALTGVDTDRLPEEKRRGITIDLGFAPLRLGPDLVLGVVDVPGHEAFVRTMVAGASGVDLAMLVIAALGGAGIGLYLPRGTAVIVETFPPAARARAMGWHEVSASAGLMLGSLYVGALLLWVDWRTTVALWSVVGVAVCLAVWRWVPEGLGPRCGPTR